jgi:hypothetical protein
VSRCDAANATRAAVVVEAVAGHVVFVLADAQAGKLLRDEHL